MKTKERGRPGWREDPLPEGAHVHVGLGSSLHKFRFHWCGWRETFILFFKALLKKHKTKHSHGCVCALCSSEWAQIDSTLLLPSHLCRSGGGSYKQNAWGRGCMAESFLGWAIRDLSHLQHDRQADEWRRNQIKTCQDFLNATAGVHVFFFNRAPEQAPLSVWDRRTDWRLEEREGADNSSAGRGVLETLSNSYFSLRGWKSYLRDFQPFTSTSCSIPAPIYLPQRQNPWSQSYMHMNYKSMVT